MHPYLKHLSKIKDKHNIKKKSSVIFLYLRFAHVLRQLIKIDII
jgi:hypothetical protein